MSIYCGSAAVNAIKYCDADGDVQDVAYVKRNGALVWVCEKSYGGLKFTANTAGSTVAMLAVGSAPSVTLLTSTDGVIWSDFTVGTTVITLANAGDYVYFKAGASGNTGMGSSVSKYNKFVMTGSIAASGNIQSLLDASLARTDVGEYCYLGLFENCSSLTTAPALRATELAKHCYGYMFRNCSCLTSAPDIPATAFYPYCYISMFYNCISLKNVPTISVSTLADNCFGYMFKGCTALKISENGGVGTIVLNVPSGTTEQTSWNAQMFTNTGGTFTGSPSVGVPYYCYQ